MFSWACSVRKVQSFSLDAAVACLDWEKQKSVNEGQMYAALSRRKHTLSLSIRNYSCCEFKVNKGATVACNRLQEAKKIKIIDIADIDSNSLTIVLPNTRSLRRLQKKLYYLLNGKPN